MARQAAIQGPTVLQVFIFREGRFWGTECFAQPAVLIGRSPECDLQLDDDITSRNHAQLSITADGMVLEDLGSSNGTYVNGQAVERCFVESRDEIAIGSFSLKVKLLSKSRPAARFRDETRVLERSAVREDLTEVVQPEQVDGDMLVDEAQADADAAPTRAEPPPQPAREVDTGRRVIAEALQEELDAFDSFDVPSTERIKFEPPAPPPSAPAAADEFAAPTQVEPAPSGRTSPQEKLDHGTRWYTPEPAEGPELQLEREPVAGTSALEQLPSPPQPEPQPTVQVSEDLLPSEQPEPAPLPGEAAAGGEDFDEEEDIPPDFVEPFSLLNNLIRENFAEPQVATESLPVVEVIGYTPQEKQVLLYDQVERGKRYRIGPERFRLLHFDEQASCTVHFTDEFSGGVISGGQTVSIDDLKTSANLLTTRKGRRIYRYKLIKGDYGNLIMGGQGWFLRFVEPPKLPPARTSFTINPTTLKIFGSSFLAHVVLIVILSFFSKPVEAGSDADIDRFAKVAMKDIQAEVPEPEAEVPLDELPKPEEQKTEEQKPEEQKPEEKKQPEKKVKPRKTRRRSKRKGSGGGGSGGGGGGVGMMAALGNLNKNRPSSNIVAAVSNLDAVRVPGARSRYKVSGIVTKLPTSSVVVSRGRGVGVKAGIDLLRGGKGRGGRAGIGPGALGGGRSGRRGVSGVVFKAPKRRMRVRGHLSREAIAKVVRQHLREIQYCYEKNLLLNPNLQGKVVMEWTIALSGSVSVVKTKKNTMAAPTVAMCIGAKIRGWKFPRPKGGIVVVTYPFIFNSIGF